MNKTLEQRVAEQTKEIRGKNEELNRSFMETIKSFSTILELRYKDVGSHSQRVAALTDKLCKGYNLNQKEYQDIVIAAYLHDIGKVGIADKIIRKPASDYTKTELEEIKKHPILGQSCVYNISGFEDIGMIIRHHHENYNGSGYPDNIREQQIPLGSRIIRIADAFDNLAFDKGYPNHDVLSESAASLVQFAESWYDPDIVKKFIKYDLAKSFLHKDSSSTIVVKTFELEEGMITASDIHTNSGMFLLPKGARLSSGMIMRIMKIDKVDPIPEGVNVYKHSMSKEDNHASVQDIAGR